MGSVTDIFKALADPTRREILVLLRDGEQSAGDLASNFDMSAPSVSKHLSILKAAQLITERRDGNKIFYHAESNRVTKCLNDFINTVCPASICNRINKKEK